MTPVDFSIRMGSETKRLVFSVTFASSALNDVERGELDSSFPVDAVEGREEDGSITR